MKLHRVKILSAFRGLSPGFEIEFKSPRKGDISIEPVCFVGLNGSGKSNVLEAICEIFYYLETYHLADRKDIAGYKTDFGFEIEYSLPKQSFGVEGVPWDELSFEWDKKEFDPIFKIVKRENEYPIISASFGSKQLQLKNKDNNRNSAVLPSRIIGYSSGMNELISNPFIKIDFHYFDNFEKRTGESVSSALDLNRMFFMDYDSNQLITICNFLFDERGFDENFSNNEFDVKEFGAKDLSQIRREIAINDLHSFSISLNLMVGDRSAPMPLPSELNLAIDKLKKCATLIHENKQERQDNKEFVGKLTLYYWVNSSTKKAFRHHFKTAYDLYRNFYFLRLLNIHLTRRILRNKVKNASLEENISSLLPKFEQESQAFFISELAFSKKGIRNHVYYRQLSDGEHQLLHTLGTIILMDTPGVLFILDEPETHLNPGWRSQFVSLLNKSIGTKSRYQDIILTSHSPFIVSDCHQEKVFSFFRKRNGKVDYKPAGFNTYGASVNLITMKLFQKKETISGLAESRIKEIQKQFSKNKMNRETAIREINKLGDSIEKMMLLDYINKSKTKNAD